MKESEERLVESKKEFEEVKIEIEKGLVELEEGFSKNEIDEGKYEEQKTDFLKIQEKIKETEEIILTEKNRIEESIQQIETVPADQ